MTSQIVSIHIPGVTDASPFLRLQRPKNQFSPESRRASNASDFHRNSEKNHTDSNLELRTIPMNIDDMPVGKGIGAGNANNSHHSRFDDNNSVDSKFASSATNSKKKSTPRGGGGGRGDYDDEIGSPAPHGQDSEVPYSRQDDRDSPRNQGGLAKARAQRQKNSEGYGEDFGSGGDTHTRCVLEELRVFFIWCDHICLSLIVSYCVFYDYLIFDVDDSVVDCDTMMVHALFLLLYISSDVMSFVTIASSSPTVLFERLPCNMQNSQACFLNLILDSIALTIDFKMELRCTVVILI